MNAGCAAPERVLAKRENSHGACRLKACSVRLQRHPCDAQSWCIRQRKSVLQLAATRNRSQRASIQRLDRRSVRQFSAWAIAARTPPSHGSFLAPFGVLAPCESAGREGGFDELLLFQPAEKLRRGRSRRRFGSSPASIFSSRVGEATELPPRSLTSESLSEAETKKPAKPAFLNPEPAGAITGER